MKKIKAPAKGRKQFFEDLKKNCSDEKVYSVIETAEEKMGIKYEQVEEWASKNKQLDKILQECRALCAEHAHDLSENGNYDDQRRAQDYILENDNEAQAEYEAEIEEQQAEEEEERKQKEAEEKKQRDLRKSVKFSTKPPSKKEGKNTLIEQEKTKTLLQHKKEVNDKLLRDRWIEKSATDQLGYEITVNKEKSDKDEYLHVEAQTNFDNHALKIFTATGTANNAGFHLLAQTIAASFRDQYPDIATQMQTLQEALIAMRPNDYQEGMLCSRIVTLHEHAMICFSRAAHPDNTVMTNNYNIGIKLMRLANEHLDTLNRYRRKGEQKVTVQHVNVNEGGQAVVAGEFTGGGGTQRKTKGEDHA